MQIIDYPSIAQDSNLFKMTQRLEAQGTNDRNYEWDDGSDHDDVTKISVRGDSNGIQYIRFDYIKSGQIKYGSFHGWTSPGLSQTVQHLE